MKRTLFTAALVISFIFAINLATLAAEPEIPDQIDKIERVRATGIGCLGIRLDLIALGCGNVQRPVGFGDSG